MRIFFLILSTTLILLGTTEMLAMGFEVHPLDESKRYLGLVLGAQIGPLSLGGTVNPVVVKLFEKFNVIVMVLGISSITYTAIGSIFSTSEEGNPMSKKYGTAWLPVRAALGVLLMFPTPQSGFCLIQVGIMWLVLQGIGAANQVWNVVLDGIESGFNILGNIPLDETAQQALTTNINELMPDVFKTITCVESLKKLNNNADLNPEPSPFIQDQTNKLNFYLASFDEPNTNAGRFNDEGATSAISADQLTYTKKSFIYAGIKTFDASIPNEYKHLCGRYLIEAIAEKANTDPDADPTRDDLTKEADKRFLHMYLAVTSIYNALNTFVTNNIVNKDNDDAQRDLDSKERELQLIGKATLESTINILSALANPLADLGPNEAVEKAKEIGWIHAPTLYFDLNDTKQELTLSTDLLNNKMPKRDQTFDFPLNDPLSNDEITFLQDKLEIAADYAENLTGFKAPASSGLSGLTTQLPKAGSETLETFFEGFPTLDRFERFIESFQSGKEPIGIIRDFGNDLMIAGELMWAIIFAGALHVLGAAAADISDLIGVIFAIKTLVMVIVTIVTSAAVMFWSFGALLAIYIPMVPFLMFSIAAIGWFVAVIEAMVGGPIIALGLITPSSQGSEELGKALPGFYILANIFLRPTLMIFGFIVSARLLYAILTLVNTALTDFLFEQTGDGAFYIFAFAAKVGIYGGFVVAVVNKSFALIYVIPNQVMRWLGAPQEGGFGEDKILGGVQQKTQAASQTSSGVLQGAGTAATQGASKALDARKQKLEQADARKRQPPPPPPKKGN